MQYTREFNTGDKGEDVRMFQTNLLALGYDLPKFGADGWYGSETETTAKKCADDRHWDHCSWGPCPIWLQERVHEEANTAPEPGGRLPEGRGMFIQSMNTLNATEAAAVVNAVGLKFVVIQAHWQYNDQASNTYNWPDSFGLKQSYGCSENARSTVETFRQMGVEVIPFSYPVPNKHAEVIDMLGKFAEVWESPTVVIDPEVEWKDSDGAHKEAALELSAMMSEEFDSWGMTSYGAPWFHRSFPYAEFSSATYGMPQSYGIGHFGTDEQMNRSHSEWHGYGYDFLVGLYGTYSKTNNEMQQILRVVANRNPFATAGWKWGTTSDVEWEHITNILPE